MQRLTNRLTLAGVLLVTVCAVPVLLGGLFVTFLESSQRAMLQTAQLVRESVASRAEAQVHAELKQGVHGLDSITRAIRSGAVAVSSESEVQTLLTTVLLDDDQVAEATFTHAMSLGFDSAGGMLTAPSSRWRLSASRSPARAEGAIVVRRDAAGDPTADSTFRTATDQLTLSQTSYSDLRYAELDEGLATERRRVVETIQRSVNDPTGAFVGVASVELLARTVDTVSRLKVNPRDPADPHQVFLCDRNGRLITRLAPEDHYAPVDGALRVESEHPPPPIARALQSPLLRKLGRDNRDESTVVEVERERYLVTFHWLSRSQDWIVGIVVPEEYYIRDLRMLRNRFLVAHVAISLCILGGGLLALRAVRRGLGSIMASAERMHRFDFSPSTGTTAFFDVQQAIDSLEHAKTVVRAMGKYIPVDLVRDLYEKNREPALGGSLQELTILFSDIRDFTPLSERLPPDVLARALGKYFEAMTGAIAASGGTVDKFIGDSVMAFWNAPTRPWPDHPALACRAALECIAATRRLYASAEWAGLPPLFTRFGINTDRVLLGHFGAPDRFNYTVLGDGVNLAARLESLCKLYGVPVLVGESVQSRAMNELVFRFVDAVAVKGRTAAVKVYEVLGEVGAVVPAQEMRHAYERAYRAYLNREFAAAAASLEGYEDDGPSAVLAERCRRYLHHPPPNDWDGTFRPGHK